MNTPSLIEIVQTMYCAFGRGEIPAILERLSPDIDWRVNVDPAAPGVARVPALRVFRGHSGAGEFFASLGRDLEFHRFEPNAFFSGGSEVAARVVMEFTIRPTQRRLRLESMHVFTFDRNGRVTQFREYADTLGVAVAWGAVQAAG